MESADSVSSIEHRLSPRREVDPGQSSVTETCSPCRQMGSGREKRDGEEENEGAEADLCNLSDLRGFLADQYWHYAHDASWNIVENLSRQMKTYVTRCQL